MYHFLLVGLGGFVGAISRHALQTFVHRFADSAHFPYGTTAVNLAGCLAIGVVGGLVEYRELFGPETRALIIVGMLGGFTTFSTFGYETYELMRAGQPGLASINVLVQVTVGIAGIWLGHSAVRFLS